MGKVLHTPLEQAEGFCILEAVSEMVVLPNAKVGLNMRAQGMSKEGSSSSRHSFTMRH